MLTFTSPLMCCGLLVAWQADGELGERPRLAFDRDRAAMLLGDDVVADRETQARALAGGLGGEERLEQLVLDLGRDAGAVVAHPHLERVSVFARRHGEAWPEGVVAALPRPLG